MIEIVFTKLSLRNNVNGIKKKSRVRRSACQVRVLSHTLDFESILTAHGILRKPKCVHVMSKKIFVFFKLFSLSRHDNICYVRFINHNMLIINKPFVFALQTLRCYV